MKSSHIMSTRRSTRSSFTKKEDEKLQKICAAMGNNISWAKVAKKIPSKTAKQCRDRWTNYLSQDFTSTPWTPAEDKRLESLVETMGKSWVAISRVMPGRSANNIKNRWHKVLRKKRDQITGKEVSDQDASAFDLLQTLSGDSASEIEFEEK